MNGNALRRFDTMRHGRDARSAGVTLTELLVVLAIVGVLATLAVPAVINRSNQAKFTAARAETKNLAQAEEACALLHGFYVPLQVLDNIPAFTAQNPIRDDTVTNVDATWALIYADISSRDQDAGNPPQPTFNDTQNPRVAALLRDWGGPFANFQRTHLSGASPGFPPAPSTNLVQLDHPLDPWGNPYRLYSPEGITGSSEGTGGTPVSLASLDQGTFSNGRISFNDDRFDRYAVVSFGPDGISDGTNITFGSGGTAEPAFGDDIIYFFGTEPRDIETGFGGIIVPTPTP